MITIALRDFKSYFRTPLAYVVLAGFLTLAGFFFFSLLGQFNSMLAQAAMNPNLHPSLNEWVITPYYRTLEIVLLFLIPILTMRTVAEEKREGTFELLATSPVSIAGIVWGKFLGVGLVVVSMLTLSFIFPLAIIIFADPEVPATVVGFFGVVLFSLLFVAAGLAISACTTNQTVAGVVSLVVFLILYILHSAGTQFGGAAQEILAALSPSIHSDLFYRGVITGTDLMYFISSTLFGLFIAVRALSAERWR